MNDNKLKEKRHLETTKKAQSPRLQRSNQTLFHLLWLLRSSNGPAVMKVLIYHDCDLIGKERKYVLLNDLGNA